MHFITGWVIFAFFVAFLVHEGNATLGEALAGTSSDTFTPYPNISQTGLPTESFSHFPTLSFPPYPTESVTSSPISPAKPTSGIGNGTPIKDFRLQCDSNSLGLVQSQTRLGIYYLRGICSGLYNDAHASRCSFLDLSAIRTTGETYVLRGWETFSVPATDVFSISLKEPTCWLVHAEEATIMAEEHKRAPFN
ncbi:hypothetical protein F4774DRAFT_424744 [Daldinia eschscholtzii]|nr:hypothetical protein F4774DRAFT_424744 [Daldinia eschscholtzii]